MPRFDRPRRTREIGLGRARPGTDLLVGWLLGHADDAGEALRATLLDQVLLGNDDAPLRACLEAHGGARAPAAICGLDDTPREMVFGCGLQQVDADAADRVEGDCLSLLSDIAANGVTEHRLGAMLDRIALQRRAPETGRQPAGLALLMRMLPAALRGADPVAVLDVDTALHELRVAARDPAWLPGLVRAQLLDNPHRACVTLVTDPSLAAARDAAEQQSLRTLAHSLDAEGRARIVEQARRIAAGEPRRGEEVALPCLGRADVEPVAVAIAGARTRLGGVPITRYRQVANGVTELLLALDADTSAMWELALLCELLPHLGRGALDARAAQARQVAICAGLSARLRVCASPTDAADVRITVTLSTRALDSHRVELASMLVQMLREPRLDDEAQLHALLSRCHARRAAALTDAGHRFAMSAAADGATPAATLQESADGLRALQMLGEMKAARPETMRALVERLHAASRSLRSVACEVALVDRGHGGDDDRLAAALAPLAVRGLAARADPAVGVSAPGESARAPVVRACDSEVGFIARAWPAPPVEHADAAVLAVLGPLVADGFLHAAVRERGGAYGAGAMYEADSATFRLFSYRDPRIAGTLDDFDRVPAWVEQASTDAGAVERAVLRAIAASEAGGSQADIALRAFLDTRNGRDAGQRQRWRNALLAVDGAALERVASLWLSPASARDAVIASEAALAAAGLRASREIAANGYTQLQ